MKKEELDILLKKAKEGDLTIEELLGFFDDLKNEIKIFNKNLADKQRT